MRSSVFYAVVSCLLLAACTRPLTTSEKAFAADLYGPSLDLTDVRVAQGLGLAPPQNSVPGDEVQVLKGTERACVRVPQPRGAQPPQAFALRQTVHFTSDVYASDMALGWPRYLRLPQALILAHEIGHVWQWQNRELTGYTPARAALESLRLADPYFSPPSSTTNFSDFGYEQQAAMIEDFVCFTMANPTHPRRAALREILSPVLPVERFEQAIVYADE